MRRAAIAFEHLESAWRREHSLSANEQLVIAFLVGDGPLTPTVLSERVGLSTAGISTLVDRLESLQFVQRRPSPDDGRRVLVTPTKKAMRARMGLDVVHAEVARSVPAADHDAVLRYLASVEREALRRAGRAPEAPESDGTTPTR